jgi:hypothetical protein
MTVPHDTAGALIAALCKVTVPHDIAVDYSPIQMKHSMGSVSLFVLSAKIGARNHCHGLTNQKINL